MPYLVQHRKASGRAQVQIHLASYMPECILLQQAASLYPLTHNHKHRHRKPNTASSSAEISPCRKRRTADEESYPFRRGDAWGPQGHRGEAELQPTRCRTGDLPKEAPPCPLKSITRSNIIHRQKKRRKLCTVP